MSLRLFFLLLFFLVFPLISFAGFPSVCDDPDIYENADGYFSDFHSFSSASVGDVYIQSTFSAASKPAYVILGIGGIYTTCGTILTQTIMISPDIHSSGYYGLLRGQFPGSTHVFNMGGRFGTITPQFPAYAGCPTGTFPMYQRTAVLKQITASSDCPSPLVPPPPVVCPDPVVCPPLPVIDGDVPPYLDGLISFENYNYSMGFSGIISAFLIMLFFAVCL